MIKTSGINVNMRYLGGVDNINISTKRLSRLGNSNGRSVSLFGAGQDITTRKAAKKKFTHTGAIDKLRDLKTSFLNCLRGIKGYKSDISTKKDALSTLFDMIVSPLNSSTTKVECFARIASFVSRDQLDKFIIIQKQPKSKHTDSNKKNASQCDMEIKFGDLILCEIDTSKSEDQAKKIFNCSLMLKRKDIADSQSDSGNSGVDDITYTMTNIFLDYMAENRTGNVDSFMRFIQDSKNTNNLNISVKLDALEIPFNHRKYGEKAEALSKIDAEMYSTYLECKNISIESLELNQIYHITEKVKKLLVFNEGMPKIRDNNDAESLFTKLKTNFDRIKEFQEIDKSFWSFMYERVSSIFRETEKEKECKQLLINVQKLLLFIANPLSNNFLGEGDENTNVGRYIKFRYYLDKSNADNSSLESFHRIDDNNSESFYSCSAELPVVE